LIYLEFTEFSREDGNILSVYQIEKQTVFKRMQRMAYKITFLNKYSQKIAAPSYAKQSRHLHTGFGQRFVATRHTNLAIGSKQTLLGLTILQD